MLACATLPLAYNDPLLSRAALLRAGAAAAATLPGTAAFAAATAEALPQQQRLSREPLDNSQWYTYSKSRSVLFDTRAKSFVPADPQRHLRQALERSSGTPKVIFAGEEHAHPMHHAMQLEVIKAARSLDDSPLCIGLEMFYRQHQPALDAFVYGDGSFDKLRKRTQWSSTWGYDLNYYAKILSYARREKIRLVGLNVPYRLVAMVASSGLESLPRELRPFLPEMDLKNPQHFERFARNIARLEEGSAGDAGSTAAGGEGSAGASGGGAHGGMHSMDSARLMHSYEAMTLWDEYMAASIAGYLKSPVPTMAAAASAASASSSSSSSSSVILGEAAAPSAQKAPPNWRMVVLAGTDHVRGHVGVPDRVTRRTGEPTFTIVPLTVPWAASGLPAIERPLSAAEGEWLFYSQERIDEAAANAPFAPGYRNAVTRPAGAVRSGGDGAEKTGRANNNNLNRGLSPRISPSVRLGAGSLVYEM